MSVEAKLNVYKKAGYWVSTVISGVGDAADIQFRDNGNYFKLHPADIRAFPEAVAVRVWEAITPRNTGCLLQYVSDFDKRHLSWGIFRYSDTNPYEELV